MEHIIFCVSLRAEGKASGVGFFPRRGAVVFSFYFFPSWAQKIITGFYKNLQFEPLSLLATKSTQTIMKKQDLLSFFVLIFQA